MTFFEFCLFFTIIYIIFPGILGILLQIPFDNIWSIILQIGSLILSGEGSKELYDTVAQVLAAFLAIVFSVSLFVIEISSEKYTHKIKKYFREDIRTKWTFGLCLFTILTCVFFILYNINNFFAGFGVFILLVLDIIFFFFYYQTMIQITNPYEIANLLEKESNKSIKQLDGAEFDDIIATLANLIIKSIKDKDAALIYKYSTVIKKIIYNIHYSDLSPSNKVKRRNAVFQQLYRAIQFAIKEGDESRIFLNGLILEAIQLEVNR